VAVGSDEAIGVTYLGLVARLSAPLRPLFPYLKPVYTVGTGLIAPFAVLASKARGGWLPTGAVSTLEEAAASSGGRAWMVREPEVVTRPVPDPAFAADASDLILRMAVAELPGGRVLGPHAAVITGRGDLVEDVSRYFGTRRPRQHPLHLHPFPPAPLDVPGRTATLDFRGGGVNHFHFVMDLLPRIALVEQCTELEPPDRWYVPANSPDRRRLLDLLGITEDRRIDSTEVPHLRAEQLIVPSIPGDEQIPPWAAEFLRSRLVPATYRRVPGRRLYLTRGPSKNNRSVLNDEEVRAALARRGFELLDPSTLTMDEEIRVFAEADIVVSPHGAGLTNLLFMSPGSLVCELFPGHNVVPTFWKLAFAVPGVAYRYVPGASGRTTSNRLKVLVQDIEVDLPALLAAVDGHG
jgi:capsular polysaccharide biosynthesis protein